MKKIIHFVFLIVFSIYFTACTSGTETTDPVALESVKVENWEGTYGYGDLKAVDGGGFLAMQKNEGGNLRFELEIQEGGDSRPSGRASGEAILGPKNQTATWITKEFGEECQLTFTLQANGGIVVNQAKGTDFDCGFGVGVSASGEFAQTSKTPVFPFEEALLAAEAKIIANLYGTYESSEEQKTKQVLVVEKLAENKIKVKSTIYGEGKEFLVLDRELSLEGTKAVFEEEKDGNACRIVFSFLANGKVDIRREEGKGCTLVADMTEVLEKKTTPSEGDS
jgi:hypothetical protein